MKAGALGPFGGQNSSSYQKKSDLLAKYAKLPAHPVRRDGMRPPQVWTLGSFGARAVWISARNCLARALPVIWAVEYPSDLN
jgi:hypothetical protein